MVTDWLDALERCQEATWSLYTSVVKACVNWWVRKKALAPHPSMALACGRKNSGIRIYTDEEKRKIFGALKDTATHQFFFALEQSGCRPISEIAEVEAMQVNLQEGTVTLSEWKNSRSTG
ncbi:MAG TPA: hypothetical protein VG013_30850 [Gemmataceae bacterium]|jgi:hypothetical protein|nr:hypothetical protein [Gemmataceae bacterium]